MGPHPYRDMFSVKPAPVGARRRSRFWRKLRVYLQVWWYRAGMTHAEASRNRRYWKNQTRLERIRKEKLEDRYDREDD